MRHAVVVGAGLAGLTATTELAGRGWRVTVVERTRLLGGKVTSFRIDGVEVDNGQHVHLACCTAFCDLVARLGMSGEMHLQPRFEVTVLERGRPASRLRAGRMPAPLHLLASFARYRALPAAAKAQVAVALLAARRPARDGESAAAWLSRHRQGAAARRGFWEPFVVPALNARLEEASADALLVVVRTAFLGDAGAARIGWSRLPLARLAEAAAAQAAEVLLRAPATALLGGPGGVQGVRLEGRSLAADGVVLAVPPARAARLLGDPAAWGLPAIDTIRSQAIVDVHLWYPGAALSFAFAAVLGSPVQWVFQKAPAYLVCSLSAAHGRVHVPERELVALCRGELEATIPALAGAVPQRTAVTRDPEATFVPAPGLRRPAPGMVAPGLALAGAWTETGWPATMESAVRSGMAAAAALDAAIPARGRAVA